MNEKLEEAISQLEEINKGLDEWELIKHELTTTTAENIELENSLRIAQDRIEELENKYELDGYDEGRY